MALWIFVVFMVALIFAVPIAMSMVLGALTPLFLGGAGSSIQQLIANSFSGSDSTPILAVPLFILGGVLMAEGGISKRLFSFFAYFVGNLTGGLPCAVILTCLFYGAISGSGPATTAAVGSMTIPFLVEMGYDKTWSAGMIATAGGLGVIIPPSIPFVLYSLATGVSTGALFLGGVLPGIAIGLGMMIYAVYYCKKKGEDKEKIRAKMKEIRSKGFFNLFKESFWALLSPVIVLGGIYSGYVTPTEAACISVFYSLFVSLFIYKSFTVKEIIPFLAKAVKTYAPLCFVLAFAIAFGRVLALAKAPVIIEGFILDNFTTSFTVLTGIVVSIFNTWNGYGYRSCHSNIGTNTVAGNSIFRSTSGALRCYNGLLLIDRFGNTTIWIGFIRGRDFIRYPSNDRCKTSNTFYNCIRYSLVCYNICTMAQSCPPVKGQVYI
jgi:C4-dicarboxylate transporter DctM subunit